VRRQSSFPGNRSHDNAKEVTMIWSDIQKAAKAQGVLVYAINQKQTVPRTQPGPWGAIQKGYCLGLCCNWVALAYQGKDFAYAQQVCEDAPWQATMAQNIDQDAPEGDWIDDWKIGTGVFNCAVSGLKAERRGRPSAAFICQVVFRAYGCYGITLVREESTHVIAMRNGRDGRLHLFDGNYFHVALKDPCAFQSFVDWYLTETGYDQRYTVLTGVTGIRPPINHTHP
jgi:hypothetical protein